MDSAVQLRSRDGESSLARSMKHLRRSLFAINMRSTSTGVLKAKHAFLEMLSGRKGRLPSGDDLSKEGGRAWDKIQSSLDGKALDLCIAGIDFSDLDMEDVDEDVDEGSGEKTPDGAPPPPPPPSLAPPPPPLSTDSFATSSDENTLKSVKIYWKPINQIKEGSLWDNLPQVSIDKEQFEKLFQLKKVETKKEAFDKPKELHILEIKRSNAINFAIRKLPPLGSLNDTILHMDCTVMNREGVEKLQNLIPSEEEIKQIKDALAENPDVPLGSAEKFLFAVGSIPFLEARLNLWMFKIDFTTMERDICEPLAWLKEGMDILSTNQTFLNIINVTLSLGNIINKTNKPAFELESLNKLATVKDTYSKKSLLYHIVTTVMTIHPDASDLYTDIEPLIKVSKVDFDELGTNLGQMEEECKNSLGSIKLASKFDMETEKLVSEFLHNAAERIISMKRIQKLLMIKYSRFLDWLGLVKHQHGDYKPTTMARIITQFATEYRTTAIKVVTDQKVEAKDFGKNIKVFPPLMFKEMAKIRAGPNCGTSE